MEKERGRNPSAIEDDTTSTCLHRTDMSFYIFFPLFFSRSTKGNSPSPTKPSNTLRSKLQLISPQASTHFPPSSFLSLLTENTPSFTFKKKTTCPVVQTYCASWLSSSPYSPSFTKPASSAQTYSPTPNYRSCSSNAPLATWPRRWTKAPVTPKI